MVEDNFHTSWLEVVEEVDRIEVDQEVEEEASFHTVAVEDRSGDEMEDPKSVDETEQPSEDETEQLSEEDLMEHADCTEDFVSEEEELTKLEVGKKDEDTDHVLVLVVVAVPGDGEALNWKSQLVDQET